MDGRTGRATALGTAGTALMGAVTWWLLATAASAWPGAGPVHMDVGLGFLAVGAAGLVAGWVTVLVASATASLAGAGRWSGSRSPGTAARSGPAVSGLTGRVAAGLLVAASLGMSPATAAETPGPAVVAATAMAQDEDVRATAAEIPVPGWTPTVTSTEQQVTPASAEVRLVSTGAVAHEQEQVVVHRGDTLWDIAARHLGEQATDEDVAEAWPRWYEANKDVIGGDPDLIHPGQRLVVPSSGGAG